MKGKKDEKRCAPKEKGNNGGNDKDKICSYDQFFDLLEYLKENGNNDLVTKLSFGNLPIDNLTDQDHKKHGAFYVSISHIEKLPEILKKKYGNKIPQSMFDLREQTAKSCAEFFPQDTYITGEQMGGQNRKYNKIERPFIALHGAIEANIDNSKVSPEYLEELCELFKLEGFVFVTNDGDRGKLKRAYFPSQKNVQKKEHSTNPQPEDFSQDGLKLCSNGLYGYDNAALTNVMTPTVIAEKNDISLTLLPYADVIKKQMEKPFDGDKMFNVLPTTGSGDAYVYGKELNPNINFENAIVEIKHDGETVLMYKDNNDEFHLLVKLQVYVWKVIKDDFIQYKIGWKKM